MLDDLQRHYQVQQQELQDLLEMEERGRVVMEQHEHKKFKRLIGVTDRHTASMSFVHCQCASHPASLWDAR